MNLDERKRLLDEMDNAAYKCAGVLIGILELHDKGVLPIPAPTVESVRRTVAAFRALESAYHAENAIDKAQA